MSRALIIAAFLEMATGLALLVVPVGFGQLLLGEALAGPAVSVARLAGLALIGLGLACWPGPARLGMLFYSGSVALGLAVLGLAGGLTGVLLWPAVILHVVLTAFLLRRP